jgi:hypothetical protein
MVKKLTLTLFGMGLIFSLPGCGGGGSKQVTTARATGRAAFSIKWPERPSKLIPIASNSIRITIMNGAAQVATVLVARPQTFASFDTLPVGSLTAVANAFPNADGTGIAQANGTVPLAITANNQTVASLTMGSTITHFAGAPNIRTISPGTRVQLTYYPVDGFGNVVLVAPGGLKITSSNPLVMAVNPDGSVTARGLGQASITVTEPESGRFDTTDSFIVEPRIYASVAGISLTSSGPASSLLQVDGMLGANPTRGFVNQPYSRSGIARDSQGRLYLASGDTGKIVRMDDISGSGLVTYDAGINADLITLDKQDRIYFCGSGLNGIVRIDNMQGTGRAEMIDVNFFEHIFYNWGIAVDSLNRIYFSDINVLNRVLRTNDMDATNSLEYLGSLSAPKRIVLDKFDRIYILDSGNGQIVRIDDIFGSGFVSYPAPFATDIAVDELGRIYIGYSHLSGHANIQRINDMSGAGLIGYNAVANDSSDNDILYLFVR